MPADLKAFGTVSRDSCWWIWEFKARRARGRVLWDRYDELYAPRFRLAADPFFTPEQRLGLLLRPKLEGIGVPTSSTVIHFLFPETVPIIDQRTARTLKAAGRVETDKTRERDYPAFCRAMEKLRVECQRTQRQMDRAFFAYDKIIHSNSGHSSNHCRGGGDNDEDP